MLLFLAKKESDGVSIAGMSEALGWLTSKGKAHKSRTYRTLEKLKRGKFTQTGRGTWKLTQAGEDEVKRLEKNARLAGSKYG